MKYISKKATNESNHSEIIVCNSELHNLLPVGPEISYLISLSLSLPHL